MSSQSNKRDNTAIIAALITVLGGGLITIIVAIINNNSSRDLALLPLQIQETQTALAVVSEMTTVAREPTITPTQVPPTYMLTFTPIITSMPPTAMPTATVISMAASVVTTPSMTPSLQPTTAPTYPCDATITDSRGDILSVVRSAPYDNSNMEDAVVAKMPIHILDKHGSDLNEWYQISDQSQKTLGWIPTEYVVLSSSCPR